MPEMMVWPDSSSVLTRKRRILGSEASEGEAHLFLVGLGLGLDGDVDDRLGEFHALENDPVVSDPRACRPWSCP